MAARSPALTPLNTSVAVSRTWLFTVTSPSAWLSGPNDAKVSVASTRLEGMQDFLVVHSSHTWMVFRRQVGRATVRFLAHGRFEE